MKTTILGGIFALAVMVAAGYGVNRSMQKDTDFSEMALKNVEALAGEIDVFLPCMETCSFCWCYYPPTENDPNDLFVESEFYL